MADETVNVSAPERLLDGLHSIVQAVLPAARAAQHEGADWLGRLEQAVAGRSKSGDGQAATVNLSTEDAHALADYLGAAVSSPQAALVASPAGGDPLGDLSQLHQATVEALPQEPEKAPEQQALPQEPEKAPEQQQG